MPEGQDKTPRREFAKLHVDYYEDDSLAAVAQTMGSHSALVLLYWPLLIAQARPRLRSKGDGWVPTTLKGIGEQAHDRSSIKTRTKLFEAFVAEGLIEVDGDLARRFRVRPTNIARLQDVGSSTARVRSHRDKNEPDDDSNGNTPRPDAGSEPLVTVTGGVSNADVTSPAPVRGERERESTSTDVDVTDDAHPEARAERQIVKERGRLGSLAMHADELAALYPGKLSSWRRDHVYRAAANLLDSFSRAVVEETIAAAVSERPDDPKAWLPKVAFKRHERAEFQAKRPSMVPGGQVDTSASKADLIRFLSEQAAS